MQNPKKIVTSFFIKMLKHAPLLQLFSTLDDIIHLSNF